MTNELLRSSERRSQCQSNFGNAVNPRRSCWKRSLPWTIFSNELCWAYPPVAYFLRTVFAPNIMKISC